MNNNCLVERIGFLVHTLELLNHFGSVWDLLPIGSFDVILLDQAEQVDQDVFACWSCNVIKYSDIVNKKIRYRYLVSNHPHRWGASPLIKEMAEVNIRFMYAAGKSGWNMSDWNNLYDIIMCYGPFHAHAFSTRTNAAVIQMGYPRFDKYFLEKPDRNYLASKYGCDPSRQTVVWLPTWKTLSSVGYFDDEVSHLSSKYNVVVKVHPLMPGSEPERVFGLLGRSFNCIITDDSDNVPLYQIADFMLFDYGGPPLAGIYTGKKMILLNVPGAELDSLTGEDSPDISIREYLVNVNANEGRISQLLEDNYLWKQQDEIMKGLRSKYFAPFYGFSSNIAAEVLTNLKYINLDKLEIS